MSGSCKRGKISAEEEWLPTLTIVFYVSATGKSAWVNALNLFLSISCDIGQRQVVLLVPRFNLYGSNAFHHSEKWWSDAEDTVKIEEFIRFGALGRRSGDHTILFLFDTVPVRLMQKEGWQTELFLNLWLPYLLYLDDWFHEQVHGTLVVLGRGLQEHSLENTIRRQL